GQRQQGGANAADTAGDGAAGGRRGRQVGGGEGDHRLQVVQGGEAAVLEGRQALARKARGTGGLPQKERAPGDVGRAARLLPARARQRAGHRAEHGHPAPAGRRVLPGGRGEGRAAGEVLRRGGEFGGGAARRLRGQRPGGHPPEAGGAPHHEAGGGRPGRGARGGARAAPRGGGRRGTRPVGLLRLGEARRPGHGLRAAAGAGGVRRRLAVGGQDGRARGGDRGVVLVGAQADPVGALGAHPGLGVRAVPEPCDADAALL
ncbi:MAG: hypothetical protein AVDCRST_MAG12-3557, partial [uncultured Rubrobacteraceae bacterium]